MDIAKFIFLNTNFKFLVKKIMILESWHPASELITKYFLSSLASLWQNTECMCLGCSAACKGRRQAGGEVVLWCFVWQFFFFFFKCRHCGTGFSFHGRSEIQAGRAAFLFVIVNLSLYLITTFPQHSKSVNRTESTVLEENTTVHILTAALSASALSFLLRKY